MKAIVRQTEGYSEDMLITMLNRTSFPSNFFEQPVSVRGVCFAAGPDSAQLAQNFAVIRLGLGTLSLDSVVSTTKTWLEMGRVFAHPQTQFARLGILLPHLDQTSAEVQEQIALAMLATDKLQWFPSASDHRKLIPALKLALVVYLGLGSDNKMQILIQPGQQLYIEPGSLKPGPRPKLN